MSDAPVVDDEDETLHCYRHPARETALQCIECDRPICVEGCAVQAAVGFKCPEHARTSRAARGVMPTARLARGLAAGGLVAIVLGALLAVTSIPFLGIILGYAVGVATGETARRASGGYRDPALARGAAALAFIGVALLPVLATLANLTDPGSGLIRSLVFSLAAAGFAAYAAYTRAS